MSISHALTSDFESIYFVDLVTDCYLDFRSGPGGELQIRPGGTDFFAQARQKLLDGVCDEDVGRVGEALSKQNLMRCLDSDEPMTLSYRRKDGAALRPCQLQTLRTRASDDHHVVVGVRVER